MNPLDVLADVAFRKWRFKVHALGKHHYLQVSWLARDCETNKVQEQKGRKWLLSTHMTKSEVVQTAFKAVMTAVEHEVRENFKYKGVAIVGPHYDVERLVALATTNPLDKRQDP